MIALRKLLRVAAIVLCALLVLLPVLPLTVFFTTTDGGGTWQAYFELLSGLALISLPFFTMTECMLLAAERCLAYRCGDISRKKLHRTLLWLLLAVLLTLATVFALAIASDRAMHATIS